MSDPSAPLRLVRFGAFQLDLRSGGLRKNGVRVSLPDQPLQVLTALLERPGEVVTREELHQRLWPSDTFVDFEHGLNAAVKRLRDVLGESADRPRFIDTVPKQGYRFIGTVQDREPGPAPDPPGIPQIGSDTAVESVALQVSSRSQRSGLALSGASVAAVTLVLLVAFAVNDGFRSVGQWLRNPLRGHIAAPDQRNLIRLTFDSGLQSDVTWSPDGRFIAYAADKAGNSDIWVQPVTGGDAVQVTKSAAQDTEPDWSPDGSTIVFRSERDGGGLFVVPALGGTERRLTAFGVRPKWSPDGSRVMFASSPDILSRATYVVGLDHSPPHPVLQAFTNDDLLYVCSRGWHPDGRVSILGYTRRQGSALFTIPLGGGTPVVTRITRPGREMPEVKQFQWSTSGATLFLEARLNYVSNVWKVAIDPRTLEAGGLERLTFGSGNDKGVSLSPDGKNVAFTTRTESSRLWSFPLDAAAARITTDGRAVTAATMAVPAAEFSPDGHTIAYSMSGIGGTGSWSLWIHDLLTGTKQELERDSIRRFSPNWSTDGRLLAYQWVRDLSDSDHEVAIAVRPAAGGDEQLLSDPRLNRAVVHGFWSPDGQALLVSTPLSTGRYAIAEWKLAAAPHAEKTQRVIASHPDHDLWGESFSPNGRWIVFEAVNRSLADATATLYVIPSAGGQATHWTPLTDVHGWADKQRWSPDGKVLYFWLRQGPLFNVWALRFDDARGVALGAPFQVTHFDTPGWQIYSADLGMTGQSVSRTSLLLPMTETTGSIWMLDNADK